MRRKENGQEPKPMRVMDAEAYDKMVALTLAYKKTLAIVEQNTREVLQYLDEVEALLKTHCGRGKRR